MRYFIARNRDLPEHMAKPATWKVNAFMALKALEQYEGRWEILDSDQHAAVGLALPGWVSQGQTMDELLANMREAIQAWLDTPPPDGTEPAEPRQVVELSV